MQVEFRSHFFRKKVRLMGREICYPIIGETYNHLQGITLKIEAEDPFKTFVTSYQNMRCHNRGKMIIVICIIMITSNLAS